MAIKRYAGDKLSGLSTDTKPTEVLGGATFFETDTQKVFIYDGSSWTEIDYSDAAHTHPASDIVSGTFVDARIAESNVTQHEAALTITESQISDLGNYSLVGHTHDAADIVSGTFADARISASSVQQHIDKTYVDSLNVDADTLDGNDSSDFEQVANKGVAGGYASLNGSGVIPNSQLPALAITETDVVADITARDSLTVEEGDVAIVTDASADPNVDSGSATYIYDGTSWQRLAGPDDAVQSVNGETGTVVLDTDDISEGSNLYYTQARFNSAFSAKSTTDLSEGTNLYYTAERVDDRVNNLLVAGTNITLTYDDGANTLTIASTATTGAAGSDQDVQYNNSGNFAGSSKFTWDNANEILEVEGHIYITEPSIAPSTPSRGSASLYIETEEISTNTVTRVMLRLSNGNDRQLASFIEPT